ncbi:MAG: phosphodiester glycosidase family protein [bacterium]|nr:phosphodiester glycosidase family protein [bacterium]
MTFPVFVTHKNISLLCLVIGSLALAFTSYQWYATNQRFVTRSAEVQLITSQYKIELEETERQLAAVEASLLELQNQDQVKRNEVLRTEITDIQKTFTATMLQYEKLLDLKDASIKTQTLDTQFTTILKLLSQRNYSSASASLQQLTSLIELEQAKLIISQPIPSNVPQISEAPGSGYRRQSVESEVGTFLVDVLAADLNSTRVVVETASAGDCGDNCPVDSLSSFVSRAGGFAGINGPYFCPAEYPSCAGKTNSFDTLLMNKNKQYFNSDNNVYSTVPAVIFSGNSARFVGQSQEWGRDTGVDSVIASQPLLLANNEIRFGGDGDPKKGSRGSRSFIGTSGSTVYIGVVRSATVAEVAYVLKKMGIQSALNLDSGGSTAFYTGGRYVAGPGRNTPLGIVLVRK